MIALDLDFDDHHKIEELEDVARDCVVMQSRTVQTDRKACHRLTDVSTGRRQVKETGRADGLAEVRTGMRKVVVVAVAVVGGFASVVEIWTVRADQTPIQN